MGDVSVQYDDRWLPVVLVRLGTWTDGQCVCSSRGATRTGVSAAAEEEKKEEEEEEEVDMGGGMDMFGDGGGGDDY